MFNAISTSFRVFNTRIILNVFSLLFRAFRQFDKQIQSMVNFFPICSLFTATSTRFSSSFLISTLKRKRKQHGYNSTEFFFICYWLEINEQTIKLDIFHGRRIYECMFIGALKKKIYFAPSFECRLLVTDKRL